MTKSDTDPVMAWIKNLGLEQAEDYVKRGRQLSAPDDEELNRLWVAALKDWAANPNAQVDHRIREDLQAEMLIRGRDPPFDRVSEDFKALKAASKAYTDKLFRDPQALASKEREISERIDAFRQSSQKKPPN